MQSRGLCYPQTQMADNPGFTDMMVSLMSSPGVLDNIVASNPMLQQMITAMPGLRDMLSNPDVVRSMLNPQMVANAMRMQSVSAKMGSKCLCGWWFFGCPVFCRSLARLSATAHAVWP